MTALLTLSHIGAVLLGAVMWHFITVKEGRALRHDEDTSVYPHREHRHHDRGPTLGAVILVIIVASLTLVGFGIQQSSFQEGIGSQTDCIEDWGANLVQVTEDRVSALTDLEQAEERRDDAVDAVLLFVTNYAGKADPNDNPPKQVYAEYVRLLKEFAKTRKELDRVRETVREERRDNPYPEMSCAR
jgi:hypothetical protein